MIRFTLFNTPLEQPPTLLAQLLQKDDASQHPDEVDVDAPLHRVFIPLFDWEQLEQLWHERLFDFVLDSIPPGGDDPSRVLLIPTHRQTAVVPSRDPSLPVVTWSFAPAPNQGENSAPVIYQRPFIPGTLPGQIPPPSENKVVVFTADRHLIARYPELLQIANNPPEEMALVRSTTIASAASLAETMFYLLEFPFRSLDDTFLFVYAMACGTVPILITNECLITDLWGIPWQELLRVPHGPSLLSVLQGLLGRCSLSEYRAIQQHHRQFVLERFSQDRVLKELGTSLSNLLQEPGKQNLPRRSRGTSGHDQSGPRITSRHELFSQMFAKLGEDWHGKAFAVYGAGQFLRKITGYFCQYAPSVQLKFIIDDNPVQQRFLGLPVLTPEQMAEQEAVDALFIASDAHEIPMRSKAATFYQGQVLGLSDFLKIQGVDEETYWSLPDFCCRDKTVEPAAPLATPLNLGTSPGKVSRPQRLQALMVCVNYADILAKTLPLNRSHFDRFVVVTAPEDKDTQRVAAQHGATVIVSESFREDGFPFNKGKMLNAGAHALEPDTWTIMLDADIILPPYTREYSGSLYLLHNCLYFAARYNINPVNLESWISSVAQSGTVDYSQLTFLHRVPVGYFELFHPQAECLRFPAICSTVFDNASGVDSHFSNQWIEHPDCHVQDLQLDVYHIPHGPNGANWSGRKIEGKATPFEPHKSTHVAQFNFQGYFAFCEIPSGGFLKIIDMARGRFAVMQNSGKNTSFLKETREFGSVKLLSCGFGAGKSYRDVFSFSGDDTPIPGWGVCWIPSLMTGAIIWDHTPQYIGELHGFELFHERWLCPEEEKYLVNETPNPSQHGEGQCDHLPI
ncbi:MAG: hypothetical protein D6820_10755 [Lentisphaerae bacterium]|nr:MAG: hypothetical protein D6820_10755 [Lentisphaerota bacterium]